MPQDISSVDLTDLAQRIGAEHDAAMGASRTAIEHAISCGHLLLEAKAKVSHGEWLQWLGRNTKLSQRTARIWIKFARNEQLLIEKSATIADLTFAEAEQLLAAPKAEEEASPANAGADDGAQDTPAAQVSPQMDEMRELVTAQEEQEMVAVSERDDLAPRRAEGDPLPPPASAHNASKVQWTLPANASGGVRALSRYREQYREQNPGAHTHDMLKNFLGTRIPPLPELSALRAMSPRQLGTIRRLVEQQCAWLTALRERIEGAAMDRPD